MAESLTLVLRLINGLFTCMFLPYLYRVYRKNHQRFYILWGIGFFLYGFSVLARTLFQLRGIETTFSMVMIFFILLSSFALIITGIGDLINRTRTLLLTSIFVPVLLLIFYFTTQPYLLGKIVSQTPYLYIGVLLIGVRYYYSKSLDLFIAGWGVVTLANMGSSFGYITPVFVEVMVIFGKVLMFICVLYSRFSYLADDFRRYLLSGVPTRYMDQRRDKIVLYNSTLGSRSSEIEWIKKWNDENSKKDIKTILVAVYDLIVEADLMVNNVQEEDMYLVRMIQGGRNRLNVFSEHVMSINDDMNDLGVLFRNIRTFSDQHKINCDIILHNLSSLIHIHGWKRIYSFLLSEIGPLKNSSVNLNILYYRNTHENLSDISKFENLVDRVSEI